MRELTFNLVTRSLAVAAATSVLVACGGGGGGGGGGFPAFPLPPVSEPQPAPPPPPPPPPPAPPAQPQPNARTFKYEGLTPSFTTHDALIASFNAQGAKGFRYLYGAFVSPEDQLAVYVKDDQTTYTYEVQPAPNTLDELRTQLESRGADGFQWIGQYGIWLSPSKPNWMIYRKDVGAATTYSYRVAQVLPATFENLFAQAKAQGAEGYYSKSLKETVANFVVGVYEKDQKRNATYAYEVLDAPDTKEESILAMANTQGERGFRLISTNNFVPGLKAIFVKDTTQNATFSFYSLPTPDSAAKQVEQANTEGAKGSGLLQTPILNIINSTSTFYFASKNCSGPLCQAAQSPYFFAN